MFEFLTFEIHIFQMTFSDGETTNFAVENFFIWIRLMSQILISKQNKDNTRKNISYGHIDDLWVEWFEEICVKVTSRGFDPRGLTCDGACVAT